jgi:hypothetical protein
VWCGSPGLASEFTEEQQRFILRLRERQVPFHLLRTDAAALALLGARQTA